MTKADKDGKEVGVVRMEVVKMGADAPPIPLPEGYKGPVMLPGTGRVVHWTGRLAIGLLHNAQDRIAPVQQSGLWIQKLLLKAKAA